MNNAASDASCTVKPAITARPRPVSVNGVTISRDAIARETQNHPSAKPIEAWQAAARALVVRELLMQEVQRLGITAVPQADDEGRRETDEEAAMRALIEREVVTPVADEAACQRYYDNNRAKFRTADLYEVRHILLPVQPGDEKTRMAARDIACAAISELQQAPERFAAMAASMSACPSGQTGGSLGQIGPGQTVPEFEKALATAPLGMVAPEPVETRYGFHIVWVNRRIMGGELPFAVARSRISGWLNEKVRRVALQQYLAFLTGQATIEGIEMIPAPSSQTH
ncbi:MAG: peptidylprolyl isomerase [Beijerinckiaceae bacterium]